MVTTNSKIDEAAVIDASIGGPIQPTPVPDPTEGVEFSKTATAAKLSGAYNETAGFFKRKWGKLTGDETLREEGRNQVIRGKVHHLVGSIRSIRESALTKVNTIRTETQVALRKHGGRMLDVAVDLVDDLKKTFFK